LVSSLGGVAKREISVPVISGNNVANDADVEAAVNNLISALGGVAN
jgi:hypothetical protein